MTSNLRFRSKKNLESFTGSIRVFLLSDGFSFFGEKENRFSESEFLRSDKSLYRFSNSSQEIRACLRILLRVPIAISL
ncbi:hypothetical protein LEP1GSC074_2791 [Leptospira noguchii str. Hook]|nr:hypothetical protein LEP1GSC041_4535 [Leptospira noguchii str. 2006001870]EMI72516.1 hypothetical protein LEP1GSC072_2453 [Leptospira noguchii str. Bonito]EMS82256.1 hypothetical protein LEP1GSC074_2791 [Leptospira noguchii str. Hook]